MVTFTHMQQKQHTQDPWSEGDIDKSNKYSQIVIGQLGQSLDGQIATATGQSKYINGQTGLEHLHRLRAWADVVVVGVGTVAADNPRLNVRLAPGRDPHRLVIDPRGRVPVDARMFSEGDVQKVVITAGIDHIDGLPDSVEVVSLALAGCGLEPRVIRQWMAQRGWNKVLLEGGATTVTRFLQADCLDYLHMIIAPMLIGEGTPGLRLPAVTDLQQARRFSALSYGLGQEQLVVCHFSA